MEDPTVNFQQEDHATVRSLRKLSVLAIAAGVLAFAGCGSSSSSTSSTPTPTSSTAPSATSSTATSSAPATSTGASSSLSLASNTEGQLKYDSSSLTAKAGKVSIAFTNQSPLAHNVTVASATGEVVGATPTFQGGEKTLSVTLKPGVYKFYCSVPGHRAAGMEGTLTVQ
jgi:plastocyanin